MWRRTVHDLPQQAHAQLCAALRHARYGDFLTLPQTRRQLRRTLGSQGAMRSSARPVVRTPRVSKRAVTSPVSAII